MEFNQRVRDWFRKQLQEYQLTPDGLSEQLKGALSRGTTTGLVGGRIRWSTLPRDDKKEIVPKLENILGQFPKEESTIVETRPVDFCAPPKENEIEELVREIEEELRNPDSPPILEPPVEPTQGLLLGSNKGSADYFEPCRRCRRPMSGTDEGRCPHCEFLSDGSQ